MSHHSSDRRFKRAMHDLFDGALDEALPPEWIALATKIDRRLERGASIGDGEPASGSTQARSPHRR